MGATGATGAAGGFDTGSVGMSGVRAIGGFDAGAPDSGSADASACVGGVVDCGKSLVDDCGNVRADGAVRTTCKRSSSCARSNARSAPAGMRRRVDDSDGLFGSSPSARRAARTDAGVCRLLASLMPSSADCNEIETLAFALLPIPGANVSPGNARLTHSAHAAVAAHNCAVAANAERRRRNEVGRAKRCCVVLSIGWFEPQ